MPFERPEAIASKYFVRYSFAAVASGTIIPLINAVGVGVQSTIGVVLIYVAGGFCVITALYSIDMQR